MTQAVTTATEKPAFSFAGLSIADAVVPRITRETSAKDNPFVDVVKSTFDLPGEQGKSITVPAANVSEGVYLLRNAAEQSGYGVRIVLSDRQGNRLSMGSEGGERKVINGKARMVGSHAIVVNADGKKFTGNVTITFKAKTRKARASR